MMKLIIDIPNYNLDRVQNGSIACSRILKAVKNGTPLPKGHGRLIDGDEIIDEIMKLGEEPDYQHEDETWQNGLYMAESVIEFAPTIIEADNE